MSFSFQALLQIHGSDVKTINTMAYQIYVSSKEAYLECILLADLIQILQCTAIAWPLSSPQCTQILQACLGYICKLLHSSSIVFFSNIFQKHVENSTGEKTIVQIIQNIRLIHSTHSSILYLQIDRVYNILFFSILRKCMMSHSLGRC